MVGIIDFYKREDVSRLVPQKRFATKEGPGYLMQISIESAQSTIQKTTEKSKSWEVRFFEAEKCEKVKYKTQGILCVHLLINVRFKLLALSKHTKQPLQKKWKILA